MQPAPAVAGVGQAALAAQRQAPTPRRGFRPAPRVPAPLRAARPRRDFRAAEGILVSPNGAARPRSGAAVADGVIELKQLDDVTPGWVYWSGLTLSIIGFFVAFVYWASTSPLLGGIWRTLFLGLMLVFMVTAVFVSVRLTRREKYHVRARAAARRAARRTVYGSRDFAVRRKQRVVRMVQEARAGVTGAGRTLRSSGTQFREGFHGDKPPNFVIRTLMAFVRAGIWVYVQLERLVKALWRVVLFFLRVGLWIYVKVVQLAWALYRGIVEPVLVLAFRLARWALGVTYRVARGTLRLAWRMFYWIVRRWPLSYATRLLEVPTRVHVAPALLSTDVVLSDALHVPVRPEVLAMARPSVDSFLLRHRARRVAALTPAYELREQERPERVALPRPEDRRAMREERLARRRADRERRKREEVDEKQRKKDAIQRAKEKRAERQSALRAAQAETKERLKSERAAGRKLSKEERKAIEQEIMRKHLPEEVQEPEPAQAQEAPAEEKAAEKARKAEEKARLKEEKAREQQEKQRAKEERNAAREEEKRERQARKEAEKESKPELKRRLKALKKDGRKLDKQGTKDLHDEIIEELVAKKLGRSPAARQTPSPAAVAEEQNEDYEPAGPDAAPEPEPEPEPVPESAEKTKKEKRGFSLKRRRGKQEEEATQDDAAAESP